MKPVIALAIGVSLLAGLVSCTGKPPKVNVLSYQLDLFRSGEGRGGDPYERLSVFAQISDEDGIKDVDAVYLINDEAGLFWKLTPADWSQKDQNGESWIGTNGFTMADYNPFPRGSYRFLVIDKGGERDEREFKLSAGATTASRMPSLDVSSAQVVIKSEFDKTVLYVLDKAENAMKTIPVRAGTYPLSSVIQGDEVARTYGFLLAAFDREGNVGFMTEQRFSPSPAAADSRAISPAPVVSGGTPPP
jgi:hypothetical protein